MSQTEHFCCTGRQKHRQLPGEDPGPHREKERGEQQSEPERTLCFFVCKYWVSKESPLLLSPTLHAAPLSQEGTSTNAATYAPPGIFWATRILLNFLEFKCRLSEEEMKTTWIIQQILYCLSHQGSPIDTLVNVLKWYISTFIWASQVALVIKNLPANAGDLRDAVSIPGSERPPGGEQSNPLQYSCWRIPWTEESAGCRIWVTKSWTRLSVWEHSYTKTQTTDFK